MRGCNLTCQMCLCLLLLFLVEQEEGKLHNPKLNQMQNTTPMWRHIKSKIIDRETNIQDYGNNKQKRDGKQEKGRRYPIKVIITANRQAELTMQCFVWHSKFKSAKSIRVNSFEAITCKTMDLLLSNLICI